MFLGFGYLNEIEAQPLVLLKLNVAPSFSAITLVMTLGAVVTPLIPPCPVDIKLLPL